MFITLACPLVSPGNTAARSARDRAIASVTINTLFWTDAADLFVFESHLSAPEVRDILSADLTLKGHIAPMTVLQCRTFKDVATSSGIDENLLRQACDL